MFRRNNQRNQQIQEDERSDTASIRSISSHSEHKSSVFDHDASSLEDESKKTDSQIVEPPSAPNPRSRKKLPRTNRSISVDEYDPSTHEFSTLALPKYERLTSEPVPVKKAESIRSLPQDERPSSAPAMMQSDENITNLKEQGSGFKR